VGEPDLIRLLAAPARGVMQNHPDCVCSAMPESSPYDDQPVTAQFTRAATFRDPLEPWRRGDVQDAFNRQRWQPMPNPDPPPPRTPDPAKLDSGTLFDGMARRICPHANRVPNIPP